MAVTKASFEGEDAAAAGRVTADDLPTFNTNPDHPDEVVQPVREVPSRAIAEAQLRHEFADSDLATLQEKKQAAVERAHALSTRPDGSYAQLHESVSPSLAVADDSAVEELREQHAAALESLRGAEPAGSPAGIRREEESARSRMEPDRSASSQPQGQQSAAAKDQAAKDQPPKGQPSK